jgi:hypothetical protein
MARNRSVALLLLAFVSALAPAADMDDLKARRLRAADAFSDGILMIHANAALDEAADGFRQDAVFYYFTGLENTVGAILAIDGRFHETWLFLPTRAPYQQSLPSEGTPASEGIKRSGIEHVADWSELRALQRRMPFHQYRFTTLRLCNQFQICRRT